jgi:hypothetical protein
VLYQLSYLAGSHMVAAEAGLDGFLRGQGMDPIPLAVSVGTRSAHLQGSLELHTRRAAQCRGTGKLVAPAALERTRAGRESTAAASTPPIPPKRCASQEIPAWGMRS